MTLVVRREIFENKLSATVPYRFILNLYEVLYIHVNDFKLNTLS